MILFNTTIQLIVGVWYLDASSYSDTVPVVKNLKYKQTLQICENNQWDIKESTCDFETGSVIKIGAGAVFIAKSTGRCLLQLRNNSNKRQNNTWGLWGGMVDNNETLRMFTLMNSEEIELSQVF